MWAGFSLAVFLVPSVLVDYYYYEKWVVSVGNLIWYNVFDPSHTGSQLFGVEPWTYYAINLFLNFNFLLFLALLSLPVTCPHHSVPYAFAHKVCSSCCYSASGVVI